MNPTDILTDRMSNKDKTIEIFKEQPFIISNQLQGNRSKPMIHRPTTRPTILENSKDTILNYNIHTYSSYSLYYHPRNIREDKPRNQLSRWSSGTQGSHQFITLKFDMPVIARSIMFGKFCQSHVCNLKEFKILGGLEQEDNMIELLHSGLKNDSEPETFSLKHRHKNRIFPIQYIKVIPLAAYGTSFNYSIWYIEVKGINEQSTVQKISQDYMNFKETEMMRLCLKYFRQKNLLDVFYLLKNRVDAELEHPMISDLYHQLVSNGDFDSVERTLNILLETNIFENYCEKSSYTVEWNRIRSTKDQGILPNGRGGHQMCIDTEKKALFLFGGYDGKSDLSDFWRYDIIEKKWSLMSPAPESESGPGQRSCHKMCYDPQSETFYVLGRYVNALEDDPLMLESDLFKYDLKTHCWTKLSRNTADDGGPDLVFDHQMCINTQTQTLYVCGGKILGVNGGSPEYSGLYSYDIISQQWSVLRMGDPDRMNVDSLINRAGHSMFMDTTNNCLYLFSGQRAHECFYDLFKYNISTGVFENIDHGNKEEFSREAGFTHRVTFDEKRQEIYIFASYTRSTKWEKIKNSFYVYSIKSNTWEVVFENENMGGRRPSLNSPLPRYAHQMVYDPTTDVHYIFGGNPGNQQGENTRLNDLWELKLKKPNSPNVYCQCLFMVRAQRLRELCMETMTKKKISIALDYLRTHVTPLVDYEDQKQVNELERLCSQVCFLGDSTYEKMSEASSYSERIQLFERLLIYIPEDMKEPIEQLTSSMKIK